MRKIANKLFSCILANTLICSSIVANPLIIKTNSSTISNKSEVEIIKSDSLKFDSIDLYQNDDYLKSLSQEQSKSSQAINLISKSTIIKGVLNNSSIDNSDASVNIIPNEDNWIGVAENSEIQWKYIFTGLGGNSNYEWTIDECNNTGEVVKSTLYKNTEPPNKLKEGVYIAHLSYTDEFDKVFNTSQMIKIEGKDDLELNIDIPTYITEIDTIEWNYEFNGTVKQAKWYLNSSELGVLPQTLASGVYNIRLEIIDALDIVHKRSMVLNVSSLDNTEPVPVEVYLSTYSYFVKMSDGTVRAWGSGSYGALCLGNQITQPSPLYIPRLKNVKYIGVGNHAGIAIMSDGGIKSWGDNTKGLLAVDKNNNANVDLIDVTTLPKNIIDIKFGASHALALTSDGEVYAWGSNNYGQLGLGTDLKSCLPTKIEQLGNNVAKIFCGGENSFAILKDGTVMCWGRNLYGVFCDGLLYSSRYAPTITLEGYNVKDIAISDTHILFLCDDGSVYSCGYNAKGQLGLGDTVSITKPKQIDFGGIPATKVKATEDISAVLLEDGSAMVFGNNTLMTLKKSGSYISEPYKMLDNCKDIYIQYKSTLLITNDNRMIMSGNGGSCGFGNSDTNVYLKELILE